MTLSTTDSAVCAKSGLGVFFFFAGFFFGVVFFAMP
jgi:hypothetical protein